MTQGLLLAQGDLQIQGSTGGFNNVTDRSHLPFYVYEKIYQHNVCRVTFAVLLYTFLLTKKNIKGVGQYKSVDSNWAHVVIHILLHNKTFNYCCGTYLIISFCYPVAQTYKLLLGLLCDMFMENFIQSWEKEVHSFLIPIFSIWHLGKMFIFSAEAQVNHLLDLPKLHNLNANYAACEGYRFYDPQLSLYLYLTLHLYFYRHFHWS